MTSPVRATRPSSRHSVDPGPDGPRLRVAPRPPRHSPSRGKRNAAVLVVTLLVVFASLLGSALLHSKLASGQLEQDRLDRQIVEENEQLRRDKLALALAQAPRRLEQDAISLGFVSGDNPTWLGPEGSSDPLAVTDADAGAVDGDTGSSGGTNDEDRPSEGTETSGTSELAMTTSNGGATR